MYCKKFKKKISFIDCHNCEYRKTPMTTKQCCHRIKKEISFMFNLIKDERALVNDFCAKINFECFVHIDADMGGVRHQSKFDFFIIKNNAILMIEAKKKSAGLREGQEMARLEMIHSGKSFYCTLRFNKKYKDNIGLLVEKTKTVNKTIEGFDEIMDFMKNYFNQFKNRGSVCFTE